MKPIANRHDLILMFDVVNGNPNGDPGAGNQPRVEPASQHGLTTDVSLKRKVRNYTQLTRPGVAGFDLIIKNGNIIEQVQNEAQQATGGKPYGEKDVEARKAHAKRMHDQLCKQYFDIRAFGQVISTGKNSPLAGSHLGQIRGPVQITFGRSYCPITINDNIITRGIPTKLADEKKDEKQTDRTMGQKYTVPYGLYYAHIGVNALYAPFTGFSQDDYDFLVEALTNLFEHDQSSARPLMTVRGLLDFMHVGVGGDADRQAKLGCAPRQRLFDLLEVETSSEFPIDYHAFDVSLDFDPLGVDDRFPGIVLTRHVDPCSWGRRRKPANRNGTLVEV